MVNCSSGLPIPCGLRGALELGGLLVFDHRILQQRLLMISGLWQQLVDLCYTSCSVTHFFLHYSITKHCRLKKQIVSPQNRCRHVHKCRNASPANLDDCVDSCCPYLALGHSLEWRCEWLCHVGFANGKFDLCVQVDHV